MNFLSDAYHKGLVENEKQIHFWEDYLQKLIDLDLSFYTNKLKVPILVPIGKRILFKGELLHTNEVTVALGASYFTKCSATQAEILRQHRITEATKKINLLKKERSYFESNLSFTKENVFSIDGHEIIEPYIKEDEDLWRDKHKENVKKYMQQKSRTLTIDKIADEELWTRLEELELQEELEQEYLSDKEDTNNTIEMVENKINLKSDIEESYLNKDNENDKYDELSTNKENDIKEILFRQKSLERQLLEIKHRERSRMQNEEDLLAHLDEIEELELVEDEMDRIDAELDIKGEEAAPEAHTISARESKKSITFADDLVETVEINFSHSDVLPSRESYDSEKGVERPSDVYTAFRHLFNFRGTSSILRKSTYLDKNVTTENATTLLLKPEEYNSNQTSNASIVVKEVIEKVGGGTKSNYSSTRPQSLFKMRKSQKKT